MSKQRKENPLEKEIEGLLESIYAEEDNDALFNDFLSYDYSYVQSYLQELGYSVKELEPKERLLTLLAGAFSDMEEDEGIADLSEEIIDSLIGDIDVYEPIAFESLPYYKLLRQIEPFQMGDISYEIRKERGFAPFLSKGRAFEEDFSIYSRPNVGCFSSLYFQPTLTQNGEIWMSLIPHEVNTMKEAISRFKGNVLIYGLGLGYALFEASEKKEVTHVTVIEKDATIISLFKERFLPLFPNKAKIEIVETDAIDFARNNQNKADYDVCFADLWRTGEDGLPLYAALKRYEGAAKENHYWIEEEIFIYFRRLYARYIAYRVTKDKGYLNDISSAPSFSFFQKKATMDTESQMDSVEGLFKKEALLEAMLDIFQD